MQIGEKKASVRLNDADRVVLARLAAVMCEQVPGMSRPTQEQVIKWALATLLAIVEQPVPQTGG